MEYGVVLECVFRTASELPWYIKKNVYFQY